MFQCRTCLLVPPLLKSPCLVLILIYFLPRSALSLSFTTKPGDPLIVVLNGNSSNVGLRWNFSLANGETLQYFNIRRHEKDKGYFLSRVVLGGTYDNLNVTLYSMDKNISSPGPSSGYIRFTIKDIMRQTDNSDGSKANPLSIDYVYSLWIKTSTSSSETSSDVEMKVLVAPTITMYGCQGCVNGSVIENRTITLLCNATGKPMPNIRWMKNGEPYNVSSPGNTLIIPQVTRDDKGNYTCIADNGIQDKKIIPILVKYRPDPPSLSLTTMDTCENKGIDVNCTADAYPPVTNYLLYNGDNYLGSSSSGQFSITATPPGKNTFCCVAANEIGDSQCGYADVYVLGVITPVCKINNETTSVATVDEGDEVVLQCDISGNESYYSYRWLEVKNSMSRNIGSAIQLRFDSINRTNEAQYQVTIKDKLNCFASQRRSFDITVTNYKPENTIIKFSSDQKVFCEGSSIQINCTADGKPEPVHSLYRNNEYLSGNENGVFFVTFAEKGDFTYTCEPNNTAGVGPKRSESVSVKGPLSSEMCTIDNKNTSHVQVKELSLVDLRLVSSELERLSFNWKNGTKTMDGLDGQNITLSPITRYQRGMYQVVARDKFNCSANVECNFAVDVHYLDDLEVIGSSNKSYSQSNPVVLFNLSVNAYPARNTTLTCNPSVPNTMTVITSHDEGIHTKQYLVVVIIQNDVNETSIVCKAQNTIGVQEKTLHIYRQPILFRTTFDGQFKITNHEWQDKLKDAKSAVYKDLRKKCIKIIENAYSGLPYFAGVNIKEFLKGSTIVRFEVQVTGQVSDPLLPLRDYIKRQGGAIDGLQIDYNSIQKSSDIEDVSPIPVSEDNKTLVAVLATLLALSIVLNILLIAGFLWLRRKDSRGFKKRSNNNDEIGQINEISLQETSLNDIPNVPEYEPVGRRGLTTSNSGIPEYEAVTTRTQPAQPQSAVETNNPIPQYESADRHRLPGADSSTPPVTYQTIQPRTGDYGSLSPSTRLPPKGTSIGSSTRAGEYQALRREDVAPQYQSLDDLSRC